MESGASTTGWLDSPLTENGRAAAEKLHKQLQQIPLPLLIVVQVVVQERRWLF